jgi:hypothetical protein
MDVRTIDANGWSNYPEMVFFIGAGPLWSGRKSTARAEETTLHLDRMRSRLDTRKYEFL